MNYRHAFHAGNFADVHKHVALTAILLHLRRKETPFVVVDTHAGRGLYNLSAGEARRTAEADQGIVRLRGHAARSSVLATYLEIAGSFDAQHYPGSPLIAAQMLRPKDRLVAIEKHPEEYHALRTALAPFANVHVTSCDGYAQLPRLLPPPERRGLILIDPSYEDADELQQVAAAFADAYRRFATGVYLFWLPLKEGSPADALIGELCNAGAPKLLFAMLDVGREPGDPPGKLTASGLLIVNPPYGFDAEMRSAGGEILPLLRRGQAANVRIEWLAGP